ncbi:excitatory amino acid transporter-like isoform X2 [Tigriopus californicus]|uniref:excitatory amino acid transporter-like isoform X2 n=1 Tax=Tigriopus californicus TaxID=6832 RepID=UPI0027DA31A5|nr:excitatory amino acid transporter-like isoform X2 [Tigriopus californicus]
MSLTNGQVSHPIKEIAKSDEPGQFKMKPEMQQVTMSKITQWISKNLLLIITFSGVSMGVLVGVLLRPYELDDLSISYIAYPGELFMRLLKLMILPLIIASLITGAASLNAKMNGMIALRTIVYFLTTSLISALIGLILVLAIHPGSTETKDALGSGTTEDRKVDIVDNFLDLGRNLFPDNIFQASFQTAHTKYIPTKIEVNTTADLDYVRELGYRSGTNTLGIIFFCLTFGTVLGSLGKKAQMVINFFSVIDEVIMKMVYGIMWISPIGISSVICAKILSVANLSSVMSQLGLFIVTVVSGIFLYQFTILQLIYFIFVRKNPFKFWWGLFQSWMTAFATASTAAALPVTFRCMQENNKVDSRISKFVLPIGATVNMDGTALFVTVASIFIAQMNDIHLDAGSLATVVLTSTATSIAAASVPSAALVLMLIVLTAIDAPYQDVSLLWAIDWFVDRCRTTNNLLGDCYGAAVVEALSKEELKAMDALRDEMEQKEHDQGLENAKAMLADKWEEVVKVDVLKRSSFLTFSKSNSRSTEMTEEERDDDVTNMSGMESPSGSINGSSVEVPEVIVVDTNTLSHNGAKN